jgi:hypothetical protein
MQDRGTHNSDIPFGEQASFYKRERKKKKTFRKVEAIIPKEQD